MKYISKCINEHKKIINFLFCFLLSFGSLVFTSKNSFLYQYNDWMDANAFFTVGKGMMNGIVPYRDLFEQKGLLLYVIYGLGYLISHKTFYGVFLLELLSFTIFLYYCGKIITQLLPKKYCYIILPIFTFLITTAFSFAHGGSAEEFSLPFMAITLYYFIKHYKRREITEKELFFSGLCAGCILMIKYTLLGFWIGFMLCIVFYYVRKKDFKNVIISCISFLLGMVLPFLGGLLYMGIHHGIGDFFHVYFYVNMTAYTKESAEFFTKLCTGFVSSLLQNGIFVFLLTILLPYFLTKIKMKTDGKIGVVVLFCTTVFFLFYGLIFYRYYIIPVFLFILLSLIGIFSIYNKRVSNNFLNPVFIMILILIFPVASYFFCNYKNELGREKSEFVQYKYADIINKEKNPTLVNMGSLDIGLYTIADILPKTYFFELQNFSYTKFPDNIDAFQEYCENATTMFILFSTRSNLQKVKEEYPTLFLNYELIEKDTFITENDTYNMFLFKRK